MKTGIYFNRTVNEITSVVDGDRHPGPQWLHVSDETGLGLLAVRVLLVEAGLVDDPTQVYWLMPQPEVDTKPILLCDSAAARPTDDGLLLRLRGSFRGARRPGYSA